MCASLRAGVDLYRELENFGLAGEAHERTCSHCRNCGRRGGSDWPKLYTEGFETRDLKEAKTLLEELARS
jgi:hypothetical protein